MPHKRKQPDTDIDTGSPGSPGSAVPRVLEARKPSGGRAFNGPEGWFPRAGVSYETVVWCAYLVVVVRVLVTRYTFQQRSLLTTSTVSPSLRPCRCSVRPL